MKMIKGNIKDIPNSFKPVEGIFKQFDMRTKQLKWEGSVEIVGYANLYMEDNGFELKITIEDLESYGYGSEIINYLMGLEDKVVIKGDSIKSAMGFWRKMGAYFHTADEDLNSFEIRKDDFKRTKYFHN